MEELTTIEKIKKIIGRILDGDAYASSELADLLEFKGLLNPITKNYIEQIDITRNSLLAEHFLLYIEPFLYQVESVVGPFKQPAPEVVDGPIRFAKTELGHWVGMFPEECHCLIAGQTDSGKSYLLFYIFIQAMLMGEYDEN